MPRSSELLCVFVFVSIKCRWLDLTSCSCFWLLVCNEQNVFLLFELISTPFLSCLFKDVVVVVVAIAIDCPQDWTLEVVVCCAEI